jgi:hypothetical protein
MYHQKGDRELHHCTKIHGENPSQFDSLRLNAANVLGKESHPNNLNYLETLLPKSLYLMNIFSISCLLTVNC